VAAVLCTHTLGGSVLSQHFLWRVPDYFCVEAALSENQRVIDKLKQDFQVYHTQAMRKEFVNIYSLRGVLKGVLFPQKSGSIQIFVQETLEPSLLAIIVVALAKRMIQKRLFRKSHPDKHYCAALFSYQCEFSVKYQDSTNFICIDDKHRVKVGEPGFPVAAVERGREVVVSLHETFAVGDHDFTRFFYHSQCCVSFEHTRLF